MVVLIRSDHIWFTCFSVCHFGHVNASNFSRFSFHQLSAVQPAHYCNIQGFQFLSLRQEKSVSHRCPYEKRTNERKEKCEEEVKRHRKLFNTNENVSNGNMKTIENVKIDEANRREKEKKKSVICYFRHETKTNGFYTIVSPCLPS